MPAKDYFDRCRETSSSTGVDGMELDGAVEGFQQLPVSLSSDDTVDYVITSGAQWEVGRGYISDGVTRTLVRSEVIDNSEGSPDKIDFSAGSKDVFISVSSKSLKELADMYSGFGMPVIVAVPEEAISSSASLVLTVYHEFGACPCYVEYDVRVTITRYGVVKKVWRGLVVRDGIADLAAVFGASETDWAISVDTSGGSEGDSSAVIITVTSAVSSTYVKVDAVARNVSNPNCV